MSYTYIYHISTIFYLSTQCANQETKECKQHKPTWLIFSPVLKHIFILYLIKPQPCPTQRDDCIKMTSQFYQNKSGAFLVFLSVANYTAKYNSSYLVSETGILRIINSDEDMTHDKARDFFLIWATQLF